MGARQSKRSVDITTTPKKEGLPVEGVVGDAAAPGDGKLEKIEETDAKPTTNGVAPPTDTNPEDKEKDKDEATEKETEKEEETKGEDAKVESPTTETPPAEDAVEATTPTEETATGPTAAASPESKETKKKDKKKKWSFRSISFGKKDKSKPAREDAPKNGDVTKEEPLAEGGEEAENVESAVAASGAAEEKKSPSSNGDGPTDKDEPSGEKNEATEATAAPVAATIPEGKNSPASKTGSAASSPIEEAKGDETTKNAVAAAAPVPVPVPSEANDKPADADNEKKRVDAESAPKAEKTVEVSQVVTGNEAPIEVSSSLSKQNDKTATTATAPSIIERKTSEEIILTQFPSSPPPTPIDPSPLQQAQQVAANATALAEALKLPAEAANKMAAADLARQALEQKIVNDDTLSVSQSVIPELCRSELESASVEIPKIPDCAEISSALGAAAPQSSLPPKDQRMGDEASSSPLIVDEKEESSATNDFVQDHRVAADGRAFEIGNVEESSSSSSSKKPETSDSDTDPLPIVEDRQVADRDPSELGSVEKPPSMKPERNDVERRSDTDPIPILEDIVVRAKPALVVPSEAPAEDEKSIRDSPRNTPAAAEEVGETDKKIDAGPGTDAIEKANEEESSVLASDNDDADDAVESAPPPPLPASPIPLPKGTSGLLNFITSQIEEEEEKEEGDFSSSVVVPETTLSFVEKNLLVETKDDEKVNENGAESNENKTIDRLPVSQVNGIDNDSSFYVLPPGKISEVPLASDTLSLEEKVPDLINAKTGAVIEDDDDDDDAAATNLLETSTGGESASILELADERSNREFKMESLEQSLNSYNDSELELKERLAESLEDNAIVNDRSANDDSVNNDQSKIEPAEVPIENNVVPNDVGTTEANDEVPKNPPPAVPIEIPAPTGPAITEDVASVTKAIEEIDINEKAVAAAVNENIESANTNEIIADMNHQNNMNE